MQRTGQTDKICQDCWNRALDAYGTGQLFLKRSQKYNALLRALSFVGIGVPLLVGAVVLAFGSNSQLLKPVIAFAAILGILQLVFSAWSLTFSWADCLQYSQESAAGNFNISQRLKELAEQAENPPDNFEALVADLKARDEERQRQDSKQAVTQKELRYAHRAGLRQFNRQCAKCGKVPTSIEPTDCDICGRF